MSDLYIATLAEMKAEVGIDDTVDDAVLTIWLLGLQGRFDARCNRKFLYSASETEYFDGGFRDLLVKRWPIDSVASIHVDADQDWEDDSELESDDYLINNRRGCIVYGVGSYAWPEGFQNVRVVYAGGFVKSDGSAAPNVDDEQLDTIRGLFFYQAGYEWRNRDTLGITQINQAGVSKQAAPAIALALKGMTLLSVVEQGLQPFSRF